MEVPGFGLQTGHWDLRNDVDNYLGKQNFSGKTVVDVGTASGYLAFEMEKRGAHVIAFDRSLSGVDDEMNIIPYYDFTARFGYSPEQAARDSVEHHRKTRNSFWLSHRLLNSRVRLYAGNVYSGMTDTGDVDVSFFGCILLHLRDPLRALARFAQITREKMIITEMHEQIGSLNEAPVMFLRATAAGKADTVTWWCLTPPLLTQFLGILGFPQCTVTFHEAWSVSGKRNATLFTVVAER